MNDAAPLNTNGHSNKGERIKRPRLARVEPRRIFEGFPDGVSRGGQNDGVDALADLARRSIATAYRVVDAQLEAGRKVAEQMGVSRPASAAQGPHEDREKASRGARALDPLIRAYADSMAELTSVWLRALLDAGTRFTAAAQADDEPAENVTTDASGDVPPGREQTPADDNRVPSPDAPVNAQPASSGSGKSQAGHETPKRPALFLPMTLRPGERGSIETPALPGTDVRELSAGALRARDESAAFVVVQVSTGAVPGSARLVVSLPSDQPTGDYDGLIYAAGGQAIGVMTLQVEGQVLSC